MFEYVARGQDVVCHMGKLEVDESDKPFKHVVVARCGEFETKRTTVRSRSMDVKEYPYWPGCEYRELRLGMQTPS